MSAPQGTSGSISPAAVKALREKTNAPMMECKAALTEAGGDMEKAIEIIRVKFAGVMAKKGEREAAEGRIAVFIDPAAKVGAILELRCESAPVAKNEHFVALANDIVKHIAIQNPGSIEDLQGLLIGDGKKTINDRIVEVVGLIRENMKVARFKRLTGLLGSYVHHDGTNGVLLQVTGKDTADEQVLKDLCMHIVATNPVAGRQEDVPPAVLERERAIAKQQAEEQGKGKPTNIIEKIAEGKLKTWLKENVLLDQPFVKDMSKNPKTVGEILKGAGLQLGTFVRYKVGEVGG
jgi:elongation factor Ts